MNSASATVRYVLGLTMKTPKTTLGRPRSLDPAVTLVLTYIVSGVTAELFSFAPRRRRRCEVLREKRFKTGMASSSRASTV